MFRYDGLEIVEQREVSLPDGASSMQLAGPTAYLGLKQARHLSVVSCCLFALN